MKYKNVFYFRSLNVIGGTETFFYYLVKKYKQYDITIICNNGNQEQINRLRKYARVLIYNGEKIRCDKIFFSYNCDIIDNVEAKEYVQIIHADYKAANISPHLHPKITKIIAVSETARKSFEELTGKKIDMIYNPVALDEYKEPILIVSATRLSQEKGKDLIEKVANKLEEEKVPFVWLVFTNDIGGIPNNHIAYMKPTLDILPYMKMADIFAQLSKNEGYGYSPVEAAMVGTTPLITDLPAFREIGFNEENSIILKLDLSNIDEVIEQIKKKNKKIKYIPKEDTWDKELIKGKSIYEEGYDMNYKVKALPSFKGVYDSTEGKYHEIGDEWIVSEARMKILTGDNKDHKVYVENLGVVKDKTNEEILLEEKQVHDELLFEKEPEPVKEPKQDILKEVEENAKKDKKKKTTKKKKA